MRGDASETFAFAEFFPGPLKPFVAVITDQIFNVLVAMRICTPFSQADISAAQSGNFMQRTAHGGVRAEAERRCVGVSSLPQRCTDASMSKVIKFGTSAREYVLLHDDVS